MEGRVGAALAGALERDRDRLNALFAEARGKSSRLSPAAFGEHLRLRLDPIVEAVSEAVPEAVGPVTRTLFELSLELFTHGVLGPGARFPRVDRVWERLLPRAATPLARSPRRIAAGLTNACCRLDELPGARSEAWLETVAAFAPLCPTPDALLAAACVAAWRSGAAHYREAALEVLGELPAEVAARALRVETFDSAELEDPWRARAGAKGERIATVARLGGFRGFGGTFLRPPRVRAEGGALFAVEGDSRWGIHADRFGATLTGAREPAGEGSESRGAFTLGRNGAVRHGSTRVELADLAGASSHASNEWTLAVTLPRSHRIYLVAIVAD